MSKLITYYNNGDIPLKTAVELPYTTIILAFLFTTPQKPLSLELGGAIAGTLTTLSDETKDAIKLLHIKGKKVLISFGGSTMNYVTYCQIVGKETELAQSISQFVIDNDLDGIDIDFEDTAAFQGKGGYNGIEFLVNLTNALRKFLPSPKYILTHAPQPPYLETDSGIDGYIAVMQKVGEKIDWLNVQFYNNPPWSSNPAEIVKSYQQFSQLQGLSADKLMVGLPVTKQDAGSGYLPINTIISEIIKPIQNKGVLGGMMNWQFSSDKQGAWAKDIGKSI